MRLLGNSVGVVLLTAVFYSGPTLAQDHKSAIDTLVRDHYPGYHPLRLSERDGDTKAFLLKHFNGSDRSVVHADLDGDGHPDYAMLIKSDTSSAARLVVLLCDTQRQCRSVHELDITGDSEGVYLSRLPIGSRVAEAEAVEGENAASPVRLTNVGIQLVYFEQATVALFWDKKSKKIVEVGTSD